MYKQEIIVPARQGDIAVAELGDPNGKPVLALHGWLDNAASYFPIAEHLKGLRILALDLAGHGKSYHRAFPYNYNIWDDLIDILDVADYFELETFGLMGHSRGAAIANLLAANSERVNRLALIDGFLSMLSGAEKTTENLTEYLAKRMRGRVRLMRYKTIDDMVKTRINAHVPLVEPAAKIITERNIKPAEDDEGYVWSTDQALRWRSAMHMSFEQARNLISNVNCPTKVWLADSSLHRYDGGRRELLDENAQIEVTVFEGSHHFHMDNSELFSAELSEFLHR